MTPNYKSEKAVDRQHDIVCDKYSAITVSRDLQVAQEMLLAPHPLVKKWLNATERVYNTHPVNKVLLPLYITMNICKRTPGRETKQDPLEPLRITCLYLIAPLHSLTMNVMKISKRIPGKDTEQDPLGVFPTQHIYFY